MAEEQFNWEYSSSSNTSSSSMVGSSRCLASSILILKNSGFPITYKHDNDEEEDDINDEIRPKSHVGTFSLSTGSEISATDCKIFCKLVNRKAFSAAIPGLPLARERWPAVLLWLFCLLHDTTGGTLILEYSEDSLAFFVAVPSIGSGKIYNPMY